jgi:hypothetical protein
MQAQVRAGETATIALFPQKGKKNLSNRRVIYRGKGKPEVHIGRNISAKVKFKFLRVGRCIEHYKRFR